MHVGASGTKFMGFLLFVRPTRISTLLLQLLLSVIHSVTNGRAVGHRVLACLYMQTVAVGM
jgi:hypothetical protein